MPSITLSNPEDKATVRRFLSSANDRIISATVVRLYVAFPDPNSWTYSGIMGAMGLIQTNTSFFFRIVDLLNGRGIVWEQELYNGIEYHQDRPFFHTIETEHYLAGFSFADEHEADVFSKKVLGRQSIKPFQPVLSAGMLAKRVSGKGGRNKIPMHNGKLDKTRIGLPSDFRHVGHIGWDPDVGFDAQNIDPAWRTIFDQLDKLGVSRQQINDNAVFITDFVTAHGGLDPNHHQGTGMDSKEQDQSQQQQQQVYREKQPYEDLSTMDSPPTLATQAIQRRKTLPPPPPPPQVISPRFQSYLPKPLAQVMASITQGASALYGSSSSTTNTTPSSTTSSRPTSPIPITEAGTSPRRSLQDDTLRSRQLQFSPASGSPPSPNSGASGLQRSVSMSTKGNSSIHNTNNHNNNNNNIMGSPPPPPPPPPPPQPAANLGRLGSGISLGGHGGGIHGPHPGLNSGQNNLRPTSPTTVLHSPVEGSLLASIREAGGVGALRKVQPRPLPAQQPLAASGQSQGDLVSALVAALQSRQTRVRTYSEDEDEGDGTDTWDADSDG